MSFLQIFCQLAIWDGLSLFQGTIQRLHNRILMFYFFRFIDTFVRKCQRVDKVDTVIRRTKRQSGEEQRRRQYDGTAMELWLGWQQISEPRLKQRNFGVFRLVIFARRQPCFIFRTKIPSKFHRLRSKNFQWESLCLCKAKTQVILTDYRVF